MQKTDEEYYGYYNSNDIMGGKKISTEKKQKKIKMMDYIQFVNLKSKMKMILL